MFDKAAITEIVKIAHANKIEPASLLAVAEVESAGKPFEPADGKTPCLLFERHIFYREIKKRRPESLQSAISAGLATPKWDKATQYHDEGTSVDRLRLFAKASKIDEECAVRACSWGVGQTMGFLAEELGFGSGVDMLTRMIAGGIPAQVDCMVREIVRKKLDRKLAAHDWAGFALGYNGQGYRANRYDTKMAAAYTKWVNALDPDEPETGATPIDIPDTRAPESDVRPMSESTIVKAGAVVAAGSGAGVGTSWWSHITDIPMSFLDTVTKLIVDKPEIVLFALCGSGGVYVIYRRWFMKREQGV